MLKFLSRRHKVKDETTLGPIDKSVIQFQDGGSSSQEPKSSATVEFSEHNSSQDNLIEAKGRKGHKLSQDDLIEEKDSTEKENVGLSPLENTNSSTGPVEDRDVSSQNSLRGTNSTSSPDDDIVGAQDRLGVNNSALEFEKEEVGNFTRKLRKPRKLEPLKLPDNENNRDVKPESPGLTDKLKSKHGLRRGDSTWDFNEQGTLLVEKVDKID